MVEELYSLDESNFKDVRPVYGLVFLFKWTGDDERHTTEPQNEPGLFFARQVVQNACATQAILSVLLNCADKIDIGETLSDFMTFTRDFPPEMKGLAISNSETIRSVHNGFSSQEPFVTDGKDDGGENQDAFHFVAFVPFNGKVFELDGLKSGPVNLGDIPGHGGNLASASCSGIHGDDWLSVASPAIEERIARHSAGEIRFNLLAIVKNRKHVATEERQRCMRRVEALDRELSSRGRVQQPEAAALSALKQEENFALESQRAAALRVAEECDVTVALEEAKFAQWRKENMRRKHDYVPFAVKLLDLLAQKTDFDDVVESMKSKAKHREDARTSAGEGSEGIK
ncbi:unnamed protein product [Ectocarpus sp. CCAP 1310/34]|nr:unnamed protein product [Ectocarpus sp. CCAP 1310/34]